MCAVLDTVDNKGPRFSSSKWVACMRLPSGRSIRGIFVVLTLFEKGVYTLI